VIAAILDRASSFREQRDTAGKMLWMKRAEQLKEDVLHICQSMDLDQDGLLTLQEVSDGSRNSEFASALAEMKINAEDTEIVFNMMDEDRTGYVTYKAFIDNIFKMKTHDDHSLLVFIKHVLCEFRSKVTTDLSKLLSESLQNSVRTAGSRDVGQTASDPRIACIAIDSSAVGCFDSASKSQSNEACGVIPVSSSKSKLRSSSRAEASYTLDATCSLSSV